MSYRKLLRYASHFEKLAQDNLCFFVDMDETLLFSFPIVAEQMEKMQAEASKNPNVKIVDWGGAGEIYGSSPNVYGCIKRPHADEFLTELNNLGQVSLATASPPPYAHAMLEAQDLKKYFNKIYTGADLTGVPKENCKNFFLIDNAPITADIIASKMQMLGVSSVLPEEASVYDWSEDEKNKFLDNADSEMSKHLIPVADFNGQPGDNGLIEALQSIKQSLSSFS